MTDTLQRTPLHAWHVANGGRMVDFGGWDMPVQYSTIVDEHNACRQRATLFDVSHMGRFRFDGKGAAEFLDSLCTRGVADLSTGRVRYSLMTNEAGGILDDILVYRLADEAGQRYWWMVVNAGNREKIAAWIQTHLGNADDVEFRDHTFETAMIAVQGPQALQVAQKLTEVKLADMKYYSGQNGTFAGEPAMISRTGYTGEDGCEVTVPTAAATQIWEKLLSTGHDVGMVAAGLGARDTLRLEAAMPLYGHELSEEINPLQAGLKFAVDLKGRDFIGREALVQIKENESSQPVRVGLAFEDRRVPRQHYAVLHGETIVGEVTSGTFSPTLNRPIAMAYVQPALAAIGTELSVDLRGKSVPAKVVKLPFYQRK